jgi:hypothetical protein
MKQPDSLKTPTAARAAIRPWAGALLAHPVACCRCAAASISGATVFAPRAGKGISDATWTPRDGPHRTRHVRVQADAEAAGIQRADLAIHQPPRLGLAHHPRQGALKKNEALFARIEQDFGVERGTLLALWGVESAYGDPLVQQNHMRPVFPSLAALPGTSRAAAPIGKPN